MPCRGAYNIFISSYHIALSIGKKNLLCRCPVMTVRDWYGKYWTAAKNNSRQSGLPAVVRSVMDMERNCSDDDVFFCHQESTQDESCLVMKQAVPPAGDLHLRDQHGDTVPGTFPGRYF